MACLGGVGGIDVHGSPIGGGFCAFVDFGLCHE
jgi:hypothetical protein